MTYLYICSLNTSILLRLPEDTTTATAMMSFLTWKFMINDYDASVLNIQQIYKNNI